MCQRIITVLHHRYIQYEYMHNIMLTCIYNINYVTILQYNMYVEHDEIRVDKNVRIYVPYVMSCKYKICYDVKYSYYHCCRVVGGGPLEFFLYMLQYIYIF